MNDEYDNDLRVPGGRGKRIVGIVLVIAVAVGGGLVIRSTCGMIREKQRWNQEVERGNERARQATLLTPAQRQKLGAGIDDATRRAVLLNGHFKAGVRWARAQHRLQLGQRCGVRQPALAPLRAPARTGAEVPLSRLHERSRETVRRVQQALKRGSDLQRDTTLVDLRGGNRYELVLLVKRSKAPVALSGRFVPGLVEGRAVLWDHRVKRVVCGAEIVATSSPQVSFQGTTFKGSAVVVGVGGSAATNNRGAVKQALRDDLMQRTRATIWAQLRALPAP